MGRQSKAGGSGSSGGDGSLVHIRPSSVLYTFSKIRPSFSGCGRTLQQTLEQIIAGELSPHDLPPIAVISAEMTYDLTNEDGEEGSEDEDSGRGKGKRGGGKGKKGGGGGAKQQSHIRYFSMNNRRLWVLRQCEERGLLGETGTVGVRMERPDVCKRLVEKGSRNFRLDRCCDKVTIMKEDKRESAKISEAGETDGADASADDA